MLHIGKIIEEEVRRQRRSITWLSQELYCDRTNVYSIFKRASIDTKLLLRISVLLNKDFFRHYAIQYAQEIRTIQKRESATPLDK